MAETDDIVARLNAQVPLSVPIPICHLLDEAADHITRLEERCAAYKGQVEAGGAEIEQMKIDAGKLRICLNCGRTADAATVKRGDDLPECRGPDGLSGCAFDATPKEAWEFWRQKAHDYMTRAEAAEREVAALKEEVGRLREVLKTVRSALVLSFNRIHVLPRTADTELAKLIGEVLAKISTSLQPQEPKP